MNFDLNKFQKNINVKFQDTKLLKKSLTHKSINKTYNNEQLEFLGDRVIGLVLSNELLKLYPKEKEGVLDKKFANLVNKKSCAHIADKLGIKKLFIKNKFIKNNAKGNNKILSDACEALIGAIFIDKGFDYVTQFIITNWKNFLNESTVIPIDSKTKLQEYSLKKYKTLPVYEILEQRGPRHDPIFKVSVKIKNSKQYIGNGSSIKDAQQNAASLLINNLL